MFRNNIDNIVQFVVGMEGISFLPGQVITAKDPGNGKDIRFKIIGIDYNDSYDFIITAERLDDEKNKGK